jgi:heparin binding hemagglutinin HbhA
MAKATFDIKTIQTLQTQAQKRARKAFHAGVGATDLAVGAVRDYAAGTQKRVVEVRKSLVDFEPRAFGTQAVKTVNGQVLAVPARVQQVVDTNVNVATEAYADLVKRGQTLVGRIRRQKSTQDTVAAAETTVAKAKTTRTQATTAAKKSSAAAKKASASKRTAAKSSAKGTRTSAKKTVSSGSRALADAAKKVGD